MAKTILINAAFPQEIRVAIVQDGELLDFDIQSQEYFRTKSNIYKGVITRLEPGLEAVFVNYGEERNGFLPIKEVINEYFNGSYNNRRDIRNLSIGQEIIVQVDKEARKDKGAALTTRITIAGRFMVLMRDAPRTHNVSRRSYGSERTETERISKKLVVPEGFGIIIRTAGIGKSKEDLEWDLNYLKNLWQKIEEESNSASAPFLILQEGDVITRTLRDHLADDTLQIVADSQEAYDTAHAIIAHATPQTANKLELYNSTIPLFTHYDVERQMQTAFQHIVKLPSGGQLVFDRTEAMFIIDVNSSQSTQGADVEQTALTNNLEATKEIARQMRIRDIGGLAVIDFIDMMDGRNKKKVEDTFRQEIQSDRARVRTSRISRFGMMELSRQRLRSSLDEFYLTKCSLCDGMGMVRTEPALAIHLHRLLWDSIQDPSTRSIKARLPDSIHNILVSHSGDHSLEKMIEKYGDKITISSDSSIRSPHFTITITYQNDREAVIKNFEEVTNNNTFYSRPEHIRKRKPVLTPQEVFAQMEVRKVSVFEKIGNWLQKLFKPSKPKRNTYSRRGKYQGSSHSQRGRYQRGRYHHSSRYRNRRYSSKPRTQSRTQSRR